MTEVTGHAEHTSAVPKTVLVPGQPAEVGWQYSLADVDPIGRSEVMIVGRPGSGKTVLAATFPPPFRWLAADGKTSLKSVRWAMQAGRTSFTNPDDVMAYSPSEDLDKGVYPTTPAAFNKMTDMIDHWFSKDQVDKWQTLVLDSFTEINEWALNMGLSMNMQFPSTSKPLSGSHKINQAAKVRLITGQQDYKSAMGLIEGFITDVRSNCSKHSKNLVVVCHEYVEDMEDDSGARKVLSIEPLLIGQLRQRIVKSFDDVWYMRVYQGATGPDIKVQVHADPLRVAKTRWGDILKREEDPDYRKLIATVKKFHEKK